MLIVVDYDGTYTADPELFTNFINMAKDGGFDVVCVTMRYKSEGRPLLDSIGKLCPVFFTGRQAKMQYMVDKGMIPDIWVDNEPHFIFKNR